MSPATERIDFKQSLETLAMYELNRDLLNETEKRRAYLLMLQLAAYVNLLGNSIPKPLKLKGTK